MLGRAVSITSNYTASFILGDDIIWVKKISDLAFSQLIKLDNQYGPVDSS